MAITRVNTDSDATWARGWEVDDESERTALLATYTSPLGPKRGDIITQLDTNVIFLVVGANLAVPLEHDDAWTIVPFDAGDYTGSGTITWTVASGDVTDFSYQFLNRRTAVLNIRVENTSISGTGNVLTIALPAAITPVKSIANACLVIDNGTISPGAFYTMSAGVAEISFLLGGFANYAAATDATGVFMSLTYEITP